LRVAIKAAMITSAATIFTVIISSATVYLTKDNVTPEKNIDNSKSSKNPIIQNSQNISVVYSEEPKDSKAKITPYDRVGKIFIGANERYLESIFGVPVVTNQINSINSKEVFYSFKRFYLQFLYDKNGALFFYSLTSKDVNFNPVIPRLGVSLGESTFSEISNDATHLYSYLTSKHYGYSEYVYLGNAGNYHNYYLAYNSSGVNYVNWPNVKTYVEGYESKSLGEFRSSMIPNSFGVGDMKGVSNDSLLYEVGVEYYTFRNESLITSK